MAHQVVCKTFGCTLQRPVADCMEAHAAWDPHASKLRTRDPVTGKWADLSIIGYVDDLTQLLVLPQESAETLDHSLRRSSEDLDSALDSTGCTQNAGKNEVAPTFVERDSNAEQRQLFTGEMNKCTGRSSRARGSLGEALT